MAARSLLLAALSANLSFTKAQTMVWSDPVPLKQCCQTGSGCHPILEQTKRTFADCFETCETYEETHGTPCVAIQYDDGGVQTDLDDTTTRTCYIAWGCDYTASGGGSIYYLQELTPEPTVPTVEPTTPTVEPTDEPSPAPSAGPSEAPSEFHCVEHGCDDPQLVCDESSGECIRNCGVFHVDDFLRDCSAEWDTVAVQQARIESLESKINDMETDTISNLESRINVMETTFNLMADLSAAHSQVGDFDGTESVGLTSAAPWISFTLDGKDAVIVCLVAVCTVMAMVMMYTCSRKRGWNAYQTVVAVSECEMQTENEKLC